MILEFLQWWYVCDCRWYDSKDDCGNSCIPVRNIYDVLFIWKCTQSSKLKCIIFWYKYKLNKNVRTTNTCIIAIISVILNSTELRFVLISL